MKQIIIEKEWLEILNDESPEFLSRVMSAIYAFFLHGTEPDNLTQAERVAFKFIRKNVELYNERYDLEAGYEAVIKRKRAEKRKAERTMQRQSDKPVVNVNPKLIKPVAPERMLPSNPLTPDTPLATRRTADGDDVFYDSFRKFHRDYLGEKDDCDTEYARFRHRFNANLDEASKLPAAIANFYSWRKKVAALGFFTEALPPLAQWIGAQGWRFRYPDL